MVFAYVYYEVISYTQFQVDVPVDQEAESLDLVNYRAVAEKLSACSVGLLFVDWQALLSHHQRHANRIVNETTFLSCDEVDLASQAVDAAAEVRVDVEERPEKAEVNDLVLPLEVLAVIPFHDGVFELANPIRVAIDFEDAVLHRSLFAVVAVGQDRVPRRPCEHWWEPLDRININHALHIE